MTQTDEKMSDYESSLRAIEEAAEALFRMGRQFTPKYPWVLVYVIQKERRSGTVYLPTDQNKPVHEGIVLATWKKLTRITKSGQMEEIKSEVAPGDHVLLHHWAGYPVSNYDAKRFRLVRELDWHETKQGGIIGTLQYQKRDQLTELVEIIQRFEKEDTRAAARVILEKYILVDKMTEAVTLSGV